MLVFLGGAGSRRRVMSPPAAELVRLENRTLLTNYVPNPQNDFAYAMHDQTVTGNVAMNDYLTSNGTGGWKDWEGDPITFVRMPSPTHGTLTLNSTTGAFTYQPNTGYAGSDSFTYKISDGIGQSFYAATVQLSITNMVPNPQNDTVSTTYNQPVQGSVALNDNLTPNGSGGWKDWEGDPITFVQNTGVGHGTLTLNSTTGAFTYQPASGFSGTDSFTYKLSDGIGQSMMFATVTIYVGSPPIDLTIYNGQGSSTAVANNQEESLGAFTVANLNDTDNDGIADSSDTNGVAGEVDLMKLVIKLPAGSMGGNVTLNVSGSVALWENSDRTTAVNLTGGMGNLSMTGTQKTIWVEVTSASTMLRDVSISASFGGTMDTVKATGIWTASTLSLTTGSSSTAVSGTGNQITLAAAAGFSAGYWIHVFDSGSWSRYRVVGVSGSTLALDRNLTTSIGGGEIVRQGFWGEVDNTKMLNKFENRSSQFGGPAVDGAQMGKSSSFYNAIAFQFVLSPVGIGDVIINYPEANIQVDISRQKEFNRWVYVTSTTGATLESSDVFPAGDGTNDDSSSEDEDTVPFNNNGAVGDSVYSRDMPGETSSVTNSLYRIVYRMNMREFVRISVNGTVFLDSNGSAQGSRASSKYDWHSRIDLMDMNSDGLWERNSNAPTNGNIIGAGYIGLGIAP